MDQIDRSARDRFAVRLLKVKNNEQYCKKFC